MGLHIERDDEHFKSIFDWNVTLPMDVLIVDEEHKDLQTNAQVLIKLNLTVREEIFGEDYD